MLHARKKNFGSCGTAHFAQNLNLEKDGFKNFGGSGGGEGIRTGRPPRSEWLLAQCPPNTPCSLADSLVFADHVRLEKGRKGEETVGSQPQAPRRKVLL